MGKILDRPLIEHDERNNCEWCGRIGYVLQISYSNKDGDVFDNPCLCEVCATMVGDGTNVPQELVEYLAANYEDRRVRDSFIDDIYDHLESFRDED